VMSKKIKQLRGKGRGKPAFFLDARVVDENFNTIFKMVGKPLVVGADELERFLKEKFK